MLKRLGDGCERGVVWSLRVVSALQRHLLLLRTVVEAVVAR